MFYEYFRYKSLYASMCSILCFGTFFYYGNVYLTSRFLVMYLTRVQRAKTMQSIFAAWQVFKRVISVVDSGRRVASFRFEVNTTANVKRGRYFSARFARRTCQRDRFFREVAFMMVRTSLRYRGLFVARFARGGLATIPFCNEREGIKSVFMLCFVLFNGFIYRATGSNSRGSYYFEAYIRLSFRRNYHFLCFLWRDRWYINWGCLISFMVFLLR